jgi:peptidoglycan/xylan/chitin deacetylase (PgdA/CDA1 family)
MIILAVILLATLATAQADITLSPKVPSAQEKVVIVMFDDGWLNQYTTALPILQSMGINASFSIYPQAMDGQWPAFMSWTQVEDLAKQGYDVESHTYSHIDLDNVSTTQLNRELVESKQILQQHGIQAGALIYPYGNSIGNATVKQAAKDAGYLVARGTDNGVVDLSNPQLDYYALNAISILNTTSPPSFGVALDNVHGPNIAILIYHKVSDTEVDAETVTTASFTQQMAYLHDNGFIVKPLSAVFFDTTPMSSTSPTPTPSSTVTPTPTPIATATSTPTPTATETPTPTPTATAQPTSTPTLTASPTPTKTPSPTATPKATPHTTPTSKPSPTANATNNTTNPPTNQSNVNPAVIAVIVVCVVAAAVAGAVFVLKRRR